MLLLSPIVVFYEKVRNCRNDFQHKESKKLSATYDYICIEDIDYKAMAQGLHLSKACRYCGCVNDQLTIADREWTCPVCGRMIDRDINAAINIKNEGLRMIS